MGLVVLLIGVGMAIAAAALFSYSLGIRKQRQNKPTRQGAAAATASPAPVPIGAHLKLPAQRTYTPFTPDDIEALVVDCTHPSCLTFTHHKGHRNPPDVEPADTSTGIVLNALLANTKGAPGVAAEHFVRRKVMVNHFDVDALLSVWCLLHPEEALQHGAVLRHAARIGDLRSAGLDAGCAAAAEAAAICRGWDGASVAEADAALKLNCWVNTIERTRFTRPYEEHDADSKFAYFLQQLGSVLEDIDVPQLRAQWQEEYDEVLSGISLLAAGREGAGAVRHADVGLAVIRTPRPLHYYSTFSCAEPGCDAVLTIMDGQRYEVESRYTQFINLHSRPVWPRLDLGPLAAALNRLDTGREAGTQWAAASMVDTGPLMRLDPGGRKLSKAERYGHPTSRPHYRSGLTPDAFETVVLSFFQHGLRGVQPKAGGFSWSELHELNHSIEWAAWEARLPALLHKHNL